MIVNPWLFYAMNVYSGAKVFAIVMASISGATFCFLGIGYFVYTIDGCEFDKNLENIAKRMIGLFVIFMLLYILTPSKDTLLLMQAAKLATTDNVNAVFESLKNAMDYAVSVLG